MNITEAVKSFFRKEPEPKLSSEPEQKDEIQNLTDENPAISSFFDDSYNNNLFGRTELEDVLKKQKEKIMKYRQLAMTPDIEDAIDEIVNEIVFSFDDKMPVKLRINEENEKLVEAIQEAFDNIMKVSNIKRNAFQIIRTGYIDGSIIFHIAYDKKNTKEGAKKISLLSPVDFYWDEKKEVYKHKGKKQEYSKEEIVFGSFGLRDGSINLGYLEYAIKPANMLRTLEDLLIPLRFSRSISRRVFNVDIGDLPSKRGAEVMKDHQSKFKYKKFYNNETGEVTNQQHITSMVEDYWFANRSGGKGTTVDVLDESGNLGELGDVIYFYKKLYKSLKIPSSRIHINPDSDQEFDYESTRVTKEDMKFFMFISRIRTVYIDCFKELLRRQVVSTGVMSDEEWNDREEEIEVYFTSENTFIERMKIDTLVKKLDIYATAQEYQGKLFSVNTILKDIFRFSDEEIEDEFKKIQKEEKDSLYAKFYMEEEDGF